MTIEETVIESEMHFPKCWLNLEKTDLYINKLSKNSVCIVDFIHFYQEKRSLYFIEAKRFARHYSPRSLGKCENCEKSKNNKDYDQIVLKFIHSINLYASLSIKRHDIKELVLDTTYLSSVNDIKLILICKYAEKTELSQIQDKLRHDLKGFCNIWHFTTNNIVVLNEDMALRKKLCLSVEDV